MYLIFISKTKIEVFKKNQKLYESNWSPETLAGIFSHLKKTFSSCFRILLSDDLIQVTSFLADSKTARKRALVQTKAQSLTSENLSQTVWDYKIISTQGNLKLVQIIIISKTFFDQFRSIISNNKIKVQLLQSFSTSLSQYLPKKQITFLIYQDLLVLSLNQNPIFSKVVGKSLTQKDIDEVFAFSQEKLKVNPQNILFYPQDIINFSQFDLHGLTPKSVDINPLESLVHPKDLNGTDAHTSHLEIKHSSTFSKFPKILLVIPVLIILAIIFVVFSDQILPSKKSTTQINPIISVTPTATPVPIDPKTFKIEVLNGSGTPGEATKITNLLAPNNLVVTKTGNAANFKFTETKIEFKSTVPQQIIDLLTKSLSGNYSPIISTTKLDSTNPFDIIITTGK